MRPDEYLALLTTKLAASYNVETSKQLGTHCYPLYAKSHVIATKYIFHRSMAYERMELDEHVLAQSFSEPVTPGDVSNFVNDLKGLIGHLVHPSYEHMSSALTGVLIAERGFTPEAAKKVTGASFTKHFWFGLRGWCFLRLLGIDLASGQVMANRRGKEVVKAYSPSQV